MLVVLPKCKGTVNYLILELLLLDPCILIEVSDGYRCRSTELSRLTAIAIEHFSTSMRFDGTVDVNRE